MTNNIYLMGFMGCGKSTLGKLLAKTLNLPFIDTDEWIEHETGLTIPKLFNIWGEDYFRKKEKDSITWVTARDNSIVALGGGSILDTENWTRICRSGLTICLNCPVEVICERVKHNTTRPLLAGSEHEKKQRISALLSQRAAYYSRAQHTVQISGLESNREIINKLLKIIKASL